MWIAFPVGSVRIHNNLWSTASSTHARWNRNERTGHIMGTFYSTQKRDELSKKCKERKRSAPLLLENIVIDLAPNHQMRGKAINIRWELTEYTKKTLSRSKKTHGPLQVYLGIGWKSANEKRRNIQANCHQQLRKTWSGSGNSHGTFMNREKQNYATLTARPMVSSDKFDCIDLIITYFIFLHLHFKGTYEKGKYLSLSVLVQLRDDGTIWEMIL